jgi:hypothetical protein
MTKQLTYGTDERYAQSRPYYDDAEDDVQECSLFAHQYADDQQYGDYDDSPRESTATGEQKIAFCRQFDEFLTDQECYDNYNVYWGYRSEGANHSTSS